MDGGDGFCVVLGVVAGDWEEVVFDRCGGGVRAVTVPLLLCMGHPGWNHERGPMRSSQAYSQVVQRLGSC